jgi:hypothetical protein
MMDRQTRQIVRERAGNIEEPQRVRLAGGIQLN